EGKTGRRVLPWYTSWRPAGEGDPAARPPAARRPLLPMARAGAGTRRRMPVPNGSRLRGHPVDAAAEAVRHARAHRGRPLDRLSTLLRYPTVSADPRHAKDMSACATWLARTLRRIGLADGTVYRGRVAPVVTGAWQGRPG